MKIPAQALVLLLLTVAHAPAASVAIQDITVMAGITEAVVAGQLQILPTPGESGATVAVPVLLPRTVAANATSAYAAAQPSLAVGRQLFRPAGFRNSEGELSGLPKGWQQVVFYFHIPPQFSGSGFAAKLMYIQPQFKNLVAFVPLSTPATSPSKISFLPGMSHALELVSRSSQPASLEDGKLIVSPRDRELILVRRLALKEPDRVSTAKKAPSRVHFLWLDPFKGLFRRAEPAQPEATPAPSILPR